LAPTKSLNQEALLTDATAIQLPQSLVDKCLEGVEIPLEEGLPSSACHLPHHLFTDYP
jgi:hypothetical protein